MDGLVTQAEKALRQIAELEARIEVLYTEREAARMGEDEFERQRDEARAEVDHLRFLAREREAERMSARSFADARREQEVAEMREHVAEAEARQRAAA